MLNKPDHASKKGVDVIWVVLSHRRILVLAAQLVLLLSVPHRNLGLICFQTCVSIKNAKKRIRIRIPVARDCCMRTRNKTPDLPLKLAIQLSGLRNQGFPLFRL